MVRVNSSTIINEIHKGADLQGSDLKRIPQEMAEKILPVFISNSIPPKLVKLYDEALNDSDKTLTIPEGKTWLIQTILIEFTTTATVGNRRIYIELLDENNNILYYMDSRADQSASKTIYYNVVSGIGSSTSDDESVITKPHDLFVKGGWKFRVFDKNAVDAAADDLKIRLIAQEYDYVKGI